MHGRLVQKLHPPLRTTETLLQGIEPGHRLECDPRTGRLFRACGGSGRTQAFAKIAENILFQSIGCRSQEPLEPEPLRDGSQRRKGEARLLERSERKEGGLCGIAHEEPDVAVRSGRRFHTHMGAEPGIGLVEAENQLAVNVSQVSLGEAEVLDFQKLSIEVPVFLKSSPAHLGLDRFERREPGGLTRSILEHGGAPDRLAMVVIRLADGHEPELVVPGDIHDQLPGRFVAVHDPGEKG